MKLTETNILEKVENALKACLQRVPFLKIESLEIKKDEIDLDDIEMLQDLIVAAINDAFKKIDKELEETLGSITQGMHIPGMF